MASAASIPIIDISESGTQDSARVAKQLVDAAAEHGFVYVRNTGQDISFAQVERAFDIVCGNGWPHPCKPYSPCNVSLRPLRATSVD